MPRPPQPPAVPPQPFAARVEGRPRVDSLAGRRRGFGIVRARGPSRPPANREQWVMPTYEYACPKCGIIDFFQSIKDAPLAKCPQCKRCKVTRLFSGGAGVIFKGSGFWETDYNRSGDYAAKAKAESGGGDSDPASKSKAQTAT